jgi:GT2 family glycosyltransferase
MRRVDEVPTQTVPPSAQAPPPTLSIVILSYNRWEALDKTLGALAEDPGVRGGEVIVVDNGSVDGTPDKLKAKYPGARLIGLKRNVGVAGFNEGVRAATGDAVLILDDDAHLAAGVLEKALALLGSRPDVAAVSLHPLHPGTRSSEWAFAERDQPGLRERWPIMGCGNLVRKTAWDRVGGYEESFFLYRNDVDLAMKLLAAGDKVYFDPQWVVWHDSPAERKSPRWFEQATRNWVWLCRRHGRGMDRVLAMLAGWAWAHRLAGWSIAEHVSVLRGVTLGLLSRVPRLPAASRLPGAMRSYLQARGLRKHA